MNIQITDEFVEDAIDQWQDLMDCDNLTLRQWFWFMSDQEYIKYIIRGDYERTEM